MAGRVAVAKAWLEEGPDGGLPVDLYALTPKELSRTCWGCGRDTSHLHHAHLHARAEGGDNNDYLNRLLLCERCHKDQPDGISREAQLLWLGVRESEFSWAFSRLVSELEKASEAFGLEFDQIPNRPVEFKGHCRSWAPYRETMLSNFCWSVASKLKQVESDGWPEPDHPIVIDFGPKPEPRDKPKRPKPKPRDPPAEIGWAHLGIKT